MKSTIMASAASLALMLWGTASAADAAAGTRTGQAATAAAARTVRPNRFPFNMIRLSRRGAAM